MTIAQRSSPFREQVRKDAAAVLLSDTGCNAMYTAVGVGAGIGNRPVVVRVSAEREDSMGAGGNNGGMQTKRGTRVSVEVPAFAAGETETVAGSGVGVSGGIKVVRTGDTFKVRGEEVHRPELAEVVLTVGPEIDLIEGAFWRAGVTL